MMNVEKLVRKNIRALTPYSSAKDEFDSTEENILLDANENSFGSVSDRTMNRYPDHLQRDLKEKLSHIKPVPPEKIFLGNGSDEAIDLLIRAFCEPGRDQILIMPPTYGMYEVCAAVNDVGIVESPLTRDFEPDVRDVFNKVHARTKLIFICSPNNPTANCFNPDGVRSILDRFDGLVVVDEAYVDFAPEKTWLTRLDDFENLVVLQTFSKAWGMANVRIGMAFAAQPVIDVLNKIKYPYNINGPSQEIALQALSNHLKKEEMVREIVAERETLARELERLSIVQKVFPSEANFLLARVTSASRIYQYLMKRNIIVRDRSGLYMCENCLRITIGTPDQNRLLLQCLREYETKGS